MTFCHIFLLHPHPVYICVYYNLLLLYLKSKPIAVKRRELVHAVHGTYKSWTLE